MAMSGRLVARALPRLAVVGSRGWHSHARRLVQASKCHHRAISVQCMGSSRFSTAAANFECINIQDSSDFQKQVLENTTPVVVDFHATWCGPCKLLAPRLESLVGSKNGQVVLAKIDVDENPELAMKYGVRSVPTVLGVKKGEVVNQFTGCQEDDIIDSFIEKLVN